MLTLAAAKQELGIGSTNTGRDADLLRDIRQVIARIRQITDRGIAWVSDSITQSDANVLVQCVGHGFLTGQVVTVYGSNSEPSIDGEHTITKVDADHFTIPTITLTADGTEASIHPLVVKQFKPIARERLWIPEQITPFLSLEELADVENDGTWTAIDTADYEMPENPHVTKAVEINRLTGWFPMGFEYPRGQYGLRRRSRENTVKATVFAGMPIAPEEVVMAGLSMVCDLWERYGRGKDESSFSFEGTSRSSMTGDERREHIFSPDSVLASWRAR